MRTAVAWALAGAAGLWAVARLAGLERGYPLVPLAAFTPLMVPGALLAAVAGMLLRRRAAAGVALAAAIALAIAVAPRVLGGPSGATGPDGPEVTVITFNMLVGRADAEAVVALVRESGADVLSLQEVRPGALRRLRDAGLEQLLPEAVIRLTAGNALFASVPLEPVPAPPGMWNPPAAGRARFPGAVEVELAAVHPPAPFNAERVAGLRDDLRALPDAGGGTVRILAGDFNSTLDHAELRRLIATGYEDAAEQVGSGLRATWPARRRFPPPVTIDHVLVDARCGVRSVEVHPVPGSDHRAVVAEVVLPAT